MDTSRHLTRNDRALQNEPIDLRSFRVSGKTLSDQMIEYASLIRAGNSGDPLRWPAFLRVVTIALIILPFLDQRIVGHGVSTLMQKATFFESHEQPNDFDRL